VDKAAEEVAPPDLRGASHGRGWRIDSFAVIRRSEFECAVWPLLVEVVDVHAEDVLELAAAEDEHPVGHSLRTLPTQRSA
jgi:hypothetical protein